jgi:translocation and assembly module TamA
VASLAGSALLAAQEPTPHPAPLIRSVTVSGLEGTGIEPGGLILPLRPGQPLSAESAEAARQVVGRRLGERGFAFATVEVLPDPPLPAPAVDVTIAVQPGPRAVFGPTLIQAEPPLRPADVRARLAYRGGDRFSVGALERTIERLRRLPVVEDVSLDLAPYRAGDSIVQTSVSVRTGPVHAVQADGTISSSRCVTGRVRAARRHLLGVPRVVEVTALGANLFARPFRGFPCTGAGEGEFADPDYLFHVGWREPVAADTWLLLDVEASRETAAQAYIRRGYQLRVGAAHSFAPGVDAVAAVAPERRDHPASGPLFCGVHAICDPAGIASVSRNVRVVPAEVEFTWMGRGAVRPPAPPLPAAATLPMWTAASRLSLAAGDARTDSRAGFARGIAEVAVTRAPGRRFEGAARLRVGALAGADGPLPPNLRLFGGGPLGVRAVQAHRLGPLILTADTAAVAALGCAPVPGGCHGREVDPREVRERPVGGSLLVEAALEGRAWIRQRAQLAAFVDAGTVRSRRRPGTPASRSPATPVLSPGIGILAPTPLGPLRLDLAYDTRPARTLPLLAPGPEGDWLDLGDVVYDPYGFEAPGGGRRLVRRLRVQLLMGNPF